MKPIAVLVSLSCAVPALVPLARRPATVGTPPQAARLEVAVDGPSRVRASLFPAVGPDAPAGPGVLVREVELADAIGGARLREARGTRFADSGVALALALDLPDGGTEYRYAVTRDLGLCPPLAAAAAAGAPAPGGWSLVAPIFRAVGAPYRIVEVHNPGSDALEITFRRGWPGTSASAVDERIFVDTCPGGAEAVQPGRSALYEVGAVEAVR